MFFIDIFKGDIVFVYEYKNRNNIKCFKDLIEIEVTDISPIKEDIVVSGYTRKNGRIVINNNGVPEKTNGIVVYKKEGDILIKKNKKYFLSYKTSKNGYDLDIKEYHGGNLFQLYACMKVDNKSYVKVRLNEMCFDSVDKIEAFCSLIKLNHFELYQEYIKGKVNDEDLIYYDFEVYYDGNYISTDSKKRLFDYACKNKNSINETAYDFNKIFSLKQTCFEISTSKV